MSNPFGYGYGPMMGGPAPVAAGGMYGHHVLRGAPGIGDFARDLNGPPESFADQTIKFRIPYTMYGEVVLTPSLNGQFFPEGSFLHSLDKPLEVWRARIILTAINDAATPVVYEPQPETLGRRVRLSMRDLSKDQAMTSDPSMVDGLQTSNFQTWEWDVPYTITRAEGFLVQCDTGAFPLVCVNEAADGAACDSISRLVERVICSISFQGFLVVLQPASESR
jgi:hypothetical protein